MRNHLYSDLADPKYWTVLVLRDDDTWWPMKVQTEKFTRAEINFINSTPGYAWVNGRNAEETAHYIKRRNMKRAAWRKGQEKAAALAAELEGVE